MSTNAPRHRGPSRGRWLPVIVAGLLGVALGAGGMAAATSASGSPAPPATAQPGASSSAPAPFSTPSSTAARPAETVRPVGPVTFVETATDAVGTSLTVLRPEKVKGGVRLTIALANTTEAPIVVNTGELGPRDPSFNGAPVPVTMTSARKRLMPGEGYTYQCVIKLPTMDVGQLTFRLGPVTVAGQAAGD